MEQWYYRGEPEWLANVTEFKESMERTRTETAEDEKEKAEEGRFAARRRVRMPFETPESEEAICQLLGRFRRRAYEQGWTWAAIEWASRGVPAAEVAKQLAPHIEPTEPEPVTWRTQFERTWDYVEGVEVLQYDRTMNFPWLRFLVQGFFLALRSGK